MSFRQEIRETSTAARERLSECTLHYEQLVWFRDKKPNLMPFGGWDRLTKLEAEKRQPHWTERE